MKKPALIIVFHSVPAVLFMFFALSMYGEYFFAVYLLMSIVFLSATVGVGIYHSRRPRALVKKPALVLFFSMMVSWIFALLTLALLNLTPLCIGKDNGDGINGISDCIMYTVVAGGIYSIMISAIVAAVAVTGGFICSRLFANAG